MRALDVDTPTFLTAQDHLTSAASIISDATRSLSIALGACAGMAGSTGAASAWAASYDAGAGAVVCGLDAAQELVGGLGDVAAATGVLHQNADGASTPGGAAVHPTLSLAVGGQCTSAPPSAHGHGSDAPEVFEQVRRWAAGLVWPDADVGRLRQAADAWTSLSTTLDDAATAVGTARASIEGNRSPEVPDAVRTLTEVVNDLRELASGASVLAETCSAYANAVETAHKALEDAAIEFVWQTVAIEAAGALVGVVTAGIGEGIAQGVEGARLAATLDRMFAAIVTVEAAANLTRAAAVARCGALAVLAERLAYRASRLRIVYEAGRATSGGISVWRVVKPIVIVAEFGSKGALNPVLRKPKAFAQYVVKGGDIVYDTGVGGRVERMTATLREVITKPARSTKIQSESGGIFRDIDDDGGHLVAATLGGGMEEINLVPMNKYQNRWQQYRQLEREWERIIKGPPRGEVELQVTLDYASPSARRPHQINVLYRQKGTTQWTPATIRN